MQNAPAVFDITLCQSFFCAKKIYIYPFVENKRQGNGKAFIPVWDDAR